MPLSLNASSKPVMISFVLSLDFPSTIIYSKSVKDCDRTDSIVSFIVSAALNQTVITLTFTFIFNPLFKARKKTYRAGSSQSFGSADPLSSQNLCPYIRHLLREPSSSLIQ